MISKLIAQKYIQVCLVQKLQALKNHTVQNNICAAV